MGRRWNWRVRARVRMVMGMEKNQVLCFSSLKRRMKLSFSGANLQQLRPALWPLPWYVLFVHARYF
jgi:hypothetical protein